MTAGWHRTGPRNWTVTFDRRTTEEIQYDAWQARAISQATQNEMCSLEWQAVNLPQASLEEMARYNNAQCNCMPAFLGIFGWLF